MPAALRFLPRLLLLPGLIFAQPLSAADDTNDADPDPEQGGLFGLGWLDSTQSFATNSANSLANQLDRFFGVPRSDIEAAYSSLRLVLEQSWNDIDNMDNDVKLRGKLHLPRITERISLIFSEDEGDGSAYYAQNGSTTSGNQTTRVNLELNLSDRPDHRIDFRVGLRSSLQGRASVRYRFEPADPMPLLSRFTQTAYFKDGKGFGSYSRHQVEKLFNETSLLRWTNDLRFEESFTGAQWSSALELLSRRSDQTGITWYGRMSGETSPDFVTNYDLGMRLRRNIGRDWLFMEFEPGYTWRKEAFNRPREGSPYVFVRLEMAIGTFN